MLVACENVPLIILELYKGSKKVEVDAITEFLDQLFIKNKYVHLQMHIHLCT